MTTEIEQSQQFSQLWEKLTPTQKRFAVAMMEHPTKKDACEAIGIAPSTAYNWNGEVDAAVDFMRNQTAVATLGIIQANATKAAMVKAKGLDSKDEKIAQAVATEILDRNLGRPTQRTEHTGADGGSIPIQFVVEERPNE